MGVCKNFTPFNDGLYNTYISNPDCLHNNFIYHKEKKALNFFDLIDIY